MATEAPAAELCPHFVAKGSCRFGSDCRFDHSQTLVRMTPFHKHPLGPDSASKRKKFFCDLCQKKSSNRFRCVVGCDFDICLNCLQQVEEAETCVVVT